MISTISKYGEIIFRFYQKNKIKSLSTCCIILIAFVSFTYWSVEATSTPQFCAQCHEIKSAYNSWKTSTHYKVPQGKKMATCRDCHLPGWNLPVSLLWAKAYHGSKDIYHHYSDKDEINLLYYEYEMKINARKDIPNSNCLKCHEDIYTSRAVNLKQYHKDIRKNYNLHCVDCHKDMVHK